MTNLLSKLALLILETKFPLRGFLPHFHLHPSPRLLPSPPPSNRAKVEARELFDMEIVSSVFGDIKQT